MPDNRQQMQAVRVAIVNAGSPVGQVLWQPSQQDLVALVGCFGGLISYEKPPVVSLPHLYLCVEF
ncbi:MAG: hypothetical protein AB8B97_08910 [Granulosicoccus sp.]